MTRMILSVKERLAIIQMLPESGTMLEMIDIMEILKKVRIEEEEKSKINYTESDGLVRWNTLADEGLEIEFKHNEITVLKAAVKRLDEEKQITPNNLDICIKINSL